MSNRGTALQRVNLNLLTSELLSGSPDCTIDVSSFRSVRVYVKLVWGAATAVNMSVRAVLVGATGSEFLDLTATYTEAVTASEEFYWDVPVNCTQVVLTFTGSGTPTTDAITVHSSVID